MKKIMRVWMVGMLGAAMLIGPNLDLALAADVVLTPAINLRGEYDDNIDFTKKKEVDDFVTTISPSLTYKYDTDQLRINSRAGVDVRRYMDESDLDDEKYLLNLGAAYQAMERLGLTANLGYIKDTTLDSYLEETGRVIAREDRQLYTAGGGLSFKMTERMNTGLNYGYRQAEFDSSDSEDYTTHSVSGFLGYKLKSQVDTLFLTPAYSWTDLETKSIDTYSVSLAWERRLSEMYRIRASVGQRWSNQEYDDIDDEDKSNGTIADVSLTRQGEITSVTVGYARDIVVGSQGELNEVDRFYAQLNRKLMERLTFQLSGALYFSSRDNERSGLENDTTYWNIAPSLSYQLTENYFLNAGYRYAHSEEDIEGDDTAVKNQVWLGLTFQFPRKW